MKVRYKIGRFSATICVCPGDTLNLTVREKGDLKHKVTEEINITATYTHWVMFYVPGVGMGGMFGTSDLAEKIHEIFVNPERVNDEDMLIV